MNTQDMKVEALQKALQSTDQYGEVEIVNFNKTWKLKASCHNLTEYGFYLFIATSSDNWHPHCSISEDEAIAFLRGMGQGAR